MTREYKQMGAMIVPILFFTIQVFGNTGINRLLDLPKDYSNGRISHNTAVAPGQTLEFADIKGPGCITHLWSTFYTKDGHGIIIRVYWDGETEPSIESPLPDFFGLGHDFDVYEPNTRKLGLCYSTPVMSIVPKNGFNCYFPMPFAKSARITITNESQTQTKGGGVYLQVDYVKYPGKYQPEYYFHSQWRKESPAARRATPYLLMQAVGKGFIAGMTYNIDVRDKVDTWYHGGGDEIFIDGQNFSPMFIRGIGGEDFVGQSWGTDVFTTPYAGCMHHRNRRDLSLYRFYLESPIRFNESVRFAFGALANEISSVAYWYQTEPHQKFFNMPPYEQRKLGADFPAGKGDIELLADKQITAAVIGPFAGDINTVYPPEEKVDLTKDIPTDYNRPFKYDENKGFVRWEKAKTTLSWLDLTAIYKPKMDGIKRIQNVDAVFYTLVRIDCNSPQTANLLIGYDDPMKIRLNGKLIKDESGKAKGVFDSMKIPLELRKGVNDILIKIDNNRGQNWFANALSLGFSDIKDAKFDAFDSLP